MAAHPDFALLKEHPFATVSTLAVAYFVSLAIYRLYLHPLAHIPGPKIAIVTQWYEFYHDVVQRGKYQAKFVDWHKQYGPIIRINPHELHCIDPAFIDTIYASGGSGRKRDKNLFYLNAFQLWHSCFGAPNHDVHRQRRSAMNPFFSKASVTKLEGNIKNYNEKVCRNIETYANTGEVLNLSAAFMCLSTDVITSYSFGWDRGYTSNRSFQPNLQQAMRGGLESAVIFRHLPLLLPFVDNYLPESIAAKLIPGGDEYFRFQHDIYDTVDDFLAGKQELKCVEGQRTIFKEVIEGPGPESEKSRQRLRESAREVIGAGVLTLASALSVIAYYLLANPDSMARLYKELEAAMPDPLTIPSSTTLEKLPYLNAVLHEGLRFSCGIATRLPRVPHEPLTYTSNPSLSAVSANPKSTTYKYAKQNGDPYRYKIPAKSIIGMSTYLTHSNPDVFPEPEKWRPERWLDESGKRDKVLDGYLLAFSKGSRQCLGINLAWAELHLTLATFVRRFGKRLELYETGPDEVEYKYDMFEVGRSSHNGIRVLVH